MNPADTARDLRRTTAPVQEAALWTATFSELSGNRHDHGEHDPDGWMRPAPQTGRVGTTYLRTARITR